MFDYQHAESAQLQPASPSCSQKGGELEDEEFHHHVSHQSLSSPSTTASSLQWQKQESASFIIAVANHQQL